MADKIHIVKTTEGCFVLPAYAIEGAGKKVKWVNLTGGEVIITFPHANVFGNPSDAFIVTLAPAGADSHHTTRAVVGQGGSKNFPYSVYCEAVSDFAYGNSNPEIIVP